MILAQYEDPPAAKVKPPEPKAGALLTTCCKGVGGNDKYGVYSLGNGKTEERLMELNSTDCGYMTPEEQEAFKALGSPMLGEWPAALKNISNT